MIKLLLLGILFYLAISVYLAYTAAAYKGKFNWYRFYKCWQLSIFWAPLGAWLLADALLYYWWLLKNRTK